MLTTRDQVKVLDFGLAKVMRDSSVIGADTASMLSIPGMVMGTVPYMSPEQVRGEELDCRSDIFSFGSVLYELLSGRRPFEAKSAAEVISAILTTEPPPISRSSLGHSGSAEEQLIRKCLEKDAALRYQTMGDLIPDLQQIRARIRKRTGYPGGRNHDCKAGDNHRRQRRKISRFKAWTSPYIPRASVGRGRRVVLLSSKPEAHTCGGLSCPPTPWPTTPTCAERSTSAARIQTIINTAIKLFEQSVAADPNFAAAYAELARAYTIKARYSATATEKKSCMRMLKSL